MKAVAPWVIAITVPACIAGCLAAGASPGAVGIGLVLAAVVVASVAAAGWLAILLFLFPFGSKIALGAGHLYVATGAVLVALLAWSLSVLFRRGVFRALPRRIGLPLGTLLALMILSALAHAADLLARPADLLRLVQLVAYLALLGLAYDLAPQGRRTAALLGVAVAAGVLEALYGLFSAPPGPGGFVVGTFDFEHNSFAAEVVMALLLAIGSFVALRTWRARGLFVPLLAVLGVALLHSQSRTGLVACAIGLFALATLPLPRGWRLFIGLGLVAGIAGGMILAPPELRERVIGLFGRTPGETHALSLSRRLGMWSAAWAAFREHPLTGEGIWSRSLTDNAFVKMAVELGILGLAAFGWFLYAVIREGRRIAVAAPRASGLFPAAIALLVVMNLAGDFFLVHRVMGTFWILAGAWMRWTEAGSPARR